jgi:hypothetical protein
MTGTWCRRAAMSMISTVFLAVSSVNHPAFAFGQDAKISREFDVNGDGALDRDEFTRALDILFRRLDRNGNGTITRAEAMKLDQGGERMELWLTQARIQALDKNGDSVITRQELLAPEQVRLLFIDIDMNGDRRLTADELGAGRLGGATLLERTTP